MKEQNESIKPALGGLQITALGSVASSVQAVPNHQNQAANDDYYVREEHIAAAKILKDITLDLSGISLLMEMEMGLAMVEMVKGKLDSGYHHLLTQLSYISYFEENYGQMYSSPEELALAATCNIRGLYNNGCQ